MKGIAIILLFFICSFSLKAQTKLIAHKSHSGLNSSFHTSLIANEGLGYGEPYDTRDLLIKIIEKDVLDSVIYLSDTVSVLAVKEYYSLPIYGDSVFVESIRDTLHHSSTVSSNKDSLDLIIKVRYYNYIYNRDSVKFVGYDQKSVLKHKKKKKGFLFVPVSSNDRYPPFDFHLFIYISCILLFSILTGWFSWRVYQLKHLIRKV